MLANLEVPGMDNANDRIGKWPFKLIQIRNFVLFRTRPWKSTIQEPEKN